MIQDLIIASRRMASLYRFKYIQPAHLLHAITANETGRDIVSREGYDVSLLRAAMIREFKAYAADVRDVNRYVEPSALFDLCCDSYLSEGDTSYDQGVEAILRCIKGYAEDDRIVFTALGEADMTLGMDASAKEEVECVPGLDAAPDEDGMDAMKSDGGGDDIEFLPGLDEFLDDDFLEGLDAPDSVEDPAQARAPRHDRNLSGDPVSGMDSAYTDRRSPPPVREKPAPKVTKDVEEARAAVKAAQRDLTELAYSGDLDPVVGRDAEIDHVIEVLLRRRKPNVILVAEPGVGKSALVEGLAIRLASNKCPDPSLSSRRVKEVSLTSMVAGSRFRGDFESRMTILIAEAEQDRSILFIDEIHMIAGSGSVTKGGMDGANILKPALARDGLSVIGATTPEEAMVLREDRALMRRFEIVYLSEPDRDQMETILNGAADKFLSGHGVRITPKTRSRVLDFGDRYLSHRRNPDRTFDILDLSAVSARLRGAAKINEDDIRHAIRRLGGEMAFMASNARPKAVSLQDYTLSRVKGNDEAVTALCGSIESIIDTGDACAIHISGPSGYGKDFCVQTIARFYKKRVTHISIDDSRGDAVELAWLRMKASAEQDPEGIIVIQATSSVFFGEIDAKIQGNHSLRYPVVVYVSSAHSSLGFGFGSTTAQSNKCIKFIEPTGSLLDDLVDAVLSEVEILQKDAGLKVTPKEIVRNRLNKCSNNSPTSYSDIRKAAIAVLGQS